MLDVLVALLSNASRKSEIANQTGFISVYLQSDSACLLLQIRSHLIKVHDSLREHADVISAVEMFEGRCIAL